MKIYILSMGKGMPRWVEEGVEEYIKRMPKNFELELREVSALKRGDNANASLIKTQESLRLLEKIPPQTYSIALDPRGKKLTTEAFADQLKHFYEEHQDITFIIGGPEGLSDTLLTKVSARWSLSELTFPHALVRILLAEQVYRAMTLIKGLPYHR